MTRHAFLGAVAVASLAIAGACSSGGDSTTAAGTTAVAGAPPVTPAVLERGHTIYKTNSVPCHGESGKGDGPGAGVLKPPPRDHTDYAYMSTLSDKQIADVIKMGGAIKGRPLMPSHPQITGADMDALVAYIRTLAIKK